MKVGDIAYYVARRRIKCSAIVSLSGERHRYAQLANGDEINSHDKHMTPAGAIEYLVEQYDRSSQQYRRSIKDYHQFIKDNAAEVAALATLTCDAEALAAAAKVELAERLERDKRDRESMDHFMKYTPPDGNYHTYTDNHETAPAPLPATIEAVNAAWDGPRPILPYDPPPPLRGNAW